MNLNDSSINFNLLTSVDAATPATGAPADAPQTQPQPGAADQLINRALDRLRPQ